MEIEIEKFRRKPDYAMCFCCLITFCKAKNSPILSNIGFFDCIPAASATAFFITRTNGGVMKLHV